MTQRNSMTGRPTGRREFPRRNRRLNGSFLETLDILETEPDIVKKLKKAEAEIRAGMYDLWKGKKR
jgi:hypothetical protein